LRQFKDWIFLWQLKPLDGCDQAPLMILNINNHNKRFLLQEKCNLCEKASLQDSNYYDFEISAKSCEEVETT